MAEEQKLALIAALQMAINASPRLRKEIAAEAGIHQSQITRLMNGKNITLYNAARLFEVLGLSITVNYPPLPQPVTDPAPPPPTSRSTVKRPRKR